MKHWIVETRRWDYNTLKQIVTHSKIKDGGSFQLCASETHENCKHAEGEIVLRKGTRVENVCFYPALHTIVLYLKTPQREEK